MQRNWQDIVEFVCGMWLCVAPFVLGFENLLGATVVTLVVGIVILLFGELGYFLSKMFEEATTLVLGVALIAAPWVLGFDNVMVPAVNAVVMGILLIVIAVTARVRDQVVDRRARAGKPEFGV